MLAAVEIVSAGDGGNGYVIKLKPMRSVQDPDLRPVIDSPGAMRPADPLKGRTILLA